MIGSRRNPSICAIFPRSQIQLESFWSQIADHGTRLQGYNKKNSWELGCYKALTYYSVYCGTFSCALAYWVPLLVGDPFGVLSPVSTKVRK